MRQEHFDLYLSSTYHLEESNIQGGEIVDATLVSKTNGARIPVRDGIPRFVDGQGYGGNFGLQWNTFRSTQLDSATGLSLSFTRFWTNTKWKPKDLFGKTVLEVGSGAGRFTEILLETGAKVVSIDLTSAVEANAKNNHSKGDLFLCQANVYHLPFAPESFDYVFCYGVLQHTPEPEKAYGVLFQMLKPGGRLSIDYYRRFSSPNVWATPKYIWRPLTHKMPPEKLLNIIKTYIPHWLPFDTFIRRIPYFGSRFLAYIPIPCWNYLHIGLTKEQRKEWAIMDTFDALGAYYDTPKTLEEVKAMVEVHPRTKADVFHGSNGVVANITKTA